MSTELLRAWETRYGVPLPERTAGGLRLYSESELARVRAMRELVTAGMAPAEAAEAIPTDAQPTESAATPPELAARLGERLEAFDDAGSQALLDEALAGFSADVVVRDIVLPTLVRIGERWANDQVSVAQEHFGSTLLRARLLALGRGWDRGGGPRAVLACPSGEQHDLGLIAFGLALRAQGWRITYLGQDTPSATLLGTVAALKPEALVVAATMPGSLSQLAAELATVPATTHVFVGGRGADDAVLPVAAKLASNPADAAREVARLTWPA